MSDIVKIALGLFGLNGLFLLGIIVFLYFWITVRLKASIENEYNKKQQELERQNAEKLESYKNTLNHQSEIALAKLTAELGLKASEKNIKLTTLFEKQAEVVATTYKYLAELHRTLELIILNRSKADVEVGEALSKQLDDSKRNFNKYFLEHKLYIPSETAEAVLDFAHKVTDTKRQLDLYDKKPAQYENAALLLDLYSSLNGEIPRLLELLENEFRNILGLSIPTKKP